MRHTPSLLERLTAVAAQLHPPIPSSVTAPVHRQPCSAVPATRPGSQRACAHTGRRLRRRASATLPAPPHAPARLHSPCASATMYPARMRRAGWSSRSWAASAAAGRSRSPRCGRPHTHTHTHTRVRHLPLQPTTSSRMSRDPDKRRHRAYLACLPSRLLRVWPRQAPLRLWSHSPGPLGANEVDIRVTHNGLCHTDLHMRVGRPHTCSAQLLRARPGLRAHLAQQLLGLQPRAATPSSNCWGCNPAHGHPCRMTTGASPSSPSSPATRRSGRTDLWAAHHSWQASLPPSPAPAKPFPPRAAQVVGEVAAVGTEVPLMHSGDRVGVGWIAGSCRRAAQPAARAAPARSPQPRGSSRRARPATQVLLGLPARR
jgi:hypothetical protein